MTPRRCVRRRRLTPVGCLEFKTFSAGTIGNDLCVVPWDFSRLRQARNARPLRSAQPYHSERVGADFHVRPSTVGFCKNPTAGASPRPTHIKFTLCGGRFFAYGSLESTQNSRRIAITVGANCVRPRVVEDADPYNLRIKFILRKFLGTTLKVVPYAYIKFISF